MRRWVLLLLSVFMLAVAIGFSAPALRLNATARLQALKARIPARPFSARLLQQQSGKNTQDSSSLSSSLPTAVESHKQHSAAGTFHSSNNHIRSTSSTATSPTMASTSPLPQHASPEQNASLSAADTLASKSNAEPSLPKLSTQDFATYNRLATMMDRYHNHFRYTWNILYQTCETGSRPPGMSLRGFITQGLHLCHSLTMHHTIEEQHVFPELAERMPSFAPNDHLISQHELIHEGLVKLQAYLNGCHIGETELRLQELKVIMDGFGEVLWTHLDDEVRMLGAESMRRYWSKQELLAFNW